MATYAKFETPKELVDKALEIVEIARNSGKLRKGMNETTKIVERGQAKVVLIAGDINPPEIVMHLPALCDEKQSIYVFVPTKAELGSAAGLDIPTSAVAVLDVGDAKKQFKELTDAYKQIKK